MAAKPDEEGNQYAFNEAESTRYGDIDDGDNCKQAAKENEGVRGKGEEEEEAISQVTKEPRDLTKLKMLA